MSLSDEVATATRIIVSGTRSGLTTRQRGVLHQYLLEQLALYHCGIVVVHGACPTGVDSETDAYCRLCGISTDPHPARWDLYGNSAGPIRNAEMINLGAVGMLAFPIGASVGTRGTIRLAKRAGMPYREIDLNEPWVPVGRFGVADQLLADWTQEELL